MLLDNAQIVYVSSADAFARDLVVGFDNDFRLEIGNLQTLTVGQTLTVAQNTDSFGTLLATGGTSWTFHASLPVHRNVY